MGYAYVDLNTINTPTTGAAAPAAWGTGVRTNFEQLKLGETIVVRTTLGSANATISCTVPTVANGWTLRVVWSASLTTGTSVNISFRVNGDTGSNYWRQINGALNTAAVIAADTAAATSLLFGSVGNESASRFSQGDIMIQDYLSTTKHKSMMGTVLDHRALTAGQFLSTVGGLWASTAAITSVSITAASSTFIAGSTLTVLATPSS